MKSPHRLSETSLNVSRAVRTILILPSGSERVNNCLRGRKNGFFMTHMDHLDSSGFIYFFHIKEKRIVTHTKAVDGQRIHLTGCSIHCFPSTHGEDSALLPSRGFCTINGDSSWVFKSISANWRKTVAPNAVLWGEKVVNSSSGSCWLSPPCVGHVEDATKLGVCPGITQLLSFENKINLQTRKMWFPSKPLKQDLPF